MEKIFLSVLNMSLTASFIIVAIMLTRLLLKKAPKVISYALWAVAGFRLIFPFTLESVFSLIPFKTAPIPQDIAMQAVPRIDSGITIIDNAVNAALPVAVPYASVNPLQIWIFIGSCVWLFGVAVMLIYSFVSIALLKRRLCGAAHIEGNIYEADNLKTPFVIGLINPTIYIPAELSGEERRYIILHEQTHIHRYDHIIKMLSYFILCPHWFNPLAWAAFILMGADMEMSCDERVIRQLGGEIKNAYSLSLVRVAAGRRILNGSPLAFGEGGMKKRIKNVLNFKKPSRVIITLAVMLVVLLSVGLAMNRATADDVEPQNIGTTYSPDSNYFIEGYGVDYDSQVSGLNPIKQFRIVEADSGKTVWSMDGLFILGSTPPFVWSSDSRYVYVAYAGRTWKDVLVVDTIGMSEHPLPGITELAPLFPDTTPDDNRPDPYIEAFSWYEHKLAVAFSWRVKEDVGNEDNRIYGEYMYDADTREYTFNSENAGNPSPIKSEEPKIDPYSFETLDYPGSHALYIFELTDGTKWTIVLSQPVRQGASGIWCVERMIDEDGNTYPAILDTDKTAADFYADRQRKADEGIGLGEGVYEGGFFLHAEATALRYLELNYENFRYDIASALLMLYPSYVLKGNITHQVIAEPNTIKFYEIEWLMKEDTERLKALDIDPNTLNNGFYVHETHAGIQRYGLSEGVTVSIIDWDNNGQTHKPISFSELEMLLGDENEYPRLWRLTFKNGLVSDITEQYLP